MNILSISWKNIMYRKLSTLLSVLLLSFGVAIIILIISASSQFEKQLTRNISGIDMVVGAKGSPLQLILSSVYQIDAPTGNIPYKEYKKLLKNPMVDKGIPLSFGDNYNGYRIVGTEPSYLEHYNAELEKGNIWDHSGEVVLGANVADMTGLDIGDEFVGSHGLKDAIEEHHEFSYKVTGILKPSGKILDNLILTHLESVWDVHGHHNGHGDHEDHHHEDHDEEKQEITSAFIKFRSPMGNLTVPRMVNQKTSMQAALPAIEINRLFSLMESGITLLRALAVLIIVLSAVSVFISIYQSLKERKAELALMRTLGSNRWRIFALLISEGLIISFLGYIVGFILGKAGIVALSSVTESNYHWSLKAIEIKPQEVWLLLIIAGVGFVAALVPSLQAYRINISKTLADA